MMFEKFCLKKARKGAALVEYALIISMLCAALYGAYKRVGTGYKSIWSLIDSSMGNKN